MIGLQGNNEIIEELDDTVEQLEKIAERQLGSRRKEALATAIRHLRCLRGSVSRAQEGQMISERNS